ncbi:hypothetical protein [Candidatus Nitrosocosmicus arcticus]|uniref:hypothetical protein n=1 Tax=Candidatus Nitrosocosmicus arcticus TaxID=2035267 RepID=UPI00119E3C11|nr:hypothetical protein [Candidatus Nitrosocosmicus arcticus]
MLTKLIFLLQLTLSLQRELIKGRKPIRKLGHPKRGKILRRLKKVSRNDVSRIKLLELNSLFGSLPRVTNIYRGTAIDALALFTLLLFLLKKLLLISILFICRVIDSLLNEEINGI